MIDRTYVAAANHFGIVFEWRLYKIGDPCLLIWLLGHLFLGGEGTRSDKVDRETKFFF